MTNERDWDEPRRAARLDLPALPTTPREARRFTRATLRRWHVPAEAIEAAELLASELTTNSCAPRDGCVSLTLWPAPGRVVIEVADHHPGRPVLTEPAPDAETGRGLLLVQALSERWGYRRLPSGGKVVYAVIATPATGS
jgi:anti-sigma regulatory factor (Ser/Thr protein kinase)